MVMSALEANSNESNGCSFGLLFHTVEPGKVHVLKNKCLVFVSGPKLQRFPGLSFT